MTLWYLSFAVVDGFVGAAIIETAESGGAGMKAASVRADELGLVPKGAEDLDVLGTEIHPDDVERLRPHKDRLLKLEDLEPLFGPISLVETEKNDEGDMMVAIDGKKVKSRRVR